MGMGNRLRIVIRGRGMSVVGRMVADGSTVWMLRNFEDQHQGGGVQTACERWDCPSCHEGNVMVLYMPFLVIQNLDGTGKYFSKVSTEAVMEVRRALPMIRQNKPYSECSPPWSA